MVLRKQSTAVEEHSLMIHGIEVISAFVPLEARPRRAFVAKLAKLHEVRSSHPAITHQSRLLTGTLVVLRGRGQLHDALGSSQCLAVFSLLFKASQGRFVGFQGFAFI